VKEDVMAEHKTTEGADAKKRGDALGLWIAIGAGAGVAFGVIFGQLALGAAIGAGLGVVVGAIVAGQSPGLRSDRGSDK
jgi:hypothetical protein